MLDILICTMDSRSRQLSELLAVLEPQVQGKPAGIIIEKDNGRLPVGAKRNILLSKAKRKYVAFVDDDDMVASNYVDLILDAIQRGNTDTGTIDCVGICGWIDIGGRRTWQFRHSVTVSNWCKDKRNKIYFRYPNHLNPVRRDIATRCCFPEKDWGEDREYSDAVKFYCQTEIFIEQPIYFYRMENK